MRVLCVSQSHPDPVNKYWGPFVKESMQALVREGVDVEAISPRPIVPPFSLPEEFEKFRRIPSRLDHGYTVHYPRYPYLLPKRIFYPISGLLHRLFIPQYVLRQCKRADVIHAQFEFPEGFGCIPIAEAWKSPLVLSSHGTILQRYARGRPESFMVRAAFRRADAVCAVSAHQARLARKIVDNPAKVVLIPIGVDPNRFRSKGRNWDITPTFLFVGSLIHRKGVDTLLDGFARASRSNNNIRLRIVGEGPLGNWMKKRAEELGVANRVTFLGTLRRPWECEEHVSVRARKTSRSEVQTGQHLSENTLVKEYSSAHAFVLPSRGEGRPTVIYEAMSCELPVIASDVGGVAEQIVDDGTGLLVQKDDCIALAKAMNLIVDNMENARLMGRKGRARILQEGWTWEAHAARLISVYENVLSGIPPSVV